MPTIYTTPNPKERSMSDLTETVPTSNEPDVAELRRLAEGATKGPWFWWGNSDNHSIALCGRQPGLGVCEVISTLGVERSTTGREADLLRSDLAECTDMDADRIEEAVREWANDEYDQPRIDQRLSVTDENHIRRTAEELAVYEVARVQGLPDDTPRDHERVYRADVCDLRATNARYIAAASPDVVLGLLDRLAHMTEARDNARAEVERLTAQVEAVRKLHRPDHYLGEPGDADCPHDADYEGPRHFENDEGMWLCEDTASDESYCTGCPTDWDGEREDYPCPTIRAFGAES